MYTIALNIGLTSLAVALLSLGASNSDKSRGGDGGWGSVIHGLSIIVGSLSAIVAIWTR